MSQLYHFAGRKDVAPEIVTDLASLNAFNTSQLKEFIDIQMEYLASPSSVDLMGAIGAFATTYGVNKSALKNTLRATLVFLQGARKYTLSVDLVKQDCASIGLTDESSAVITQCWTNHWPALSRELLKNTLTINQLVDLDWKFGVTASSDELQQVGSSFLQLKLKIDRGGGVSEDVLMELSIEQFYGFLAQMEKAKSVMDMMSMK